MMGTSPCKGCSDRHIACHGSCERYLNWKNDHIAERFYTTCSKQNFYPPITESRERGMNQKLKKVRDKIYGRGV